MRTIMLLFLFTVNLFGKTYVYEIKNNSGNSIGMMFMETQKGDSTISFVVSVQNKGISMQDSTLVNINKKGEFKGLRGSKQISTESGMSIAVSYRIKVKGNRMEIVKKRGEATPVIVSLEKYKTTPQPVPFSFFYLPSKSKLKGKFYFFMPPFKDIYEGKIRKDGSSEVECGLGKIKTTSYLLEYDKRKFKLYVGKDGLVVKLEDKIQNRHYILKAVE